MPEHIAADVSAQPHDDPSAAAVDSAEAAEAGVAWPGLTHDPGVAHDSSVDGPTDDGDDESSLTVLLALGANVGVGILKLAAGLVTGSSALLSEAAHSAGDSTTEILLLVAQKRSHKRADRAHPFGYGKELYFWSMLASMAILISGAGFSIYEGLSTVLEGSETGNYYWINYPVLLVAALLEGTSLRQAALQMRRETRRTRRSLSTYLVTPRDPTVNSVLLEDSAAIAGLLIAGIGVALRQITGNPMWDGLASILIGLLLLVVAIVLARACQALLIGRQADPRLIARIVEFLEQQDEIVDVVDVLTMLTGTDSILLCTRADFVDTLTAADLERACLRIDSDLRQRFGMLGEIFIQPASVDDEGLRGRVERRYGHKLADD